MNQAEEGRLDKQSQEVEENKRYCNQCQREIHQRANKCYQCGSHQNKWFERIAIVPVVMVILTVVQLILASLEKIETSRILREVEAIENKAKGMLADVEKIKGFVSEHLAEINGKIINIDDSIKTTEQSLTEKVEKLSERIVFINNDTEYLLKSSIQKVDEQVRNSQDKLLKTESEFNQKNQIINKDIHKLKEEVSGELEKLKWRDDLMVLTDEAISKGKRSSLDKLMKLKKDHTGTEKIHSVNSNILQIKIFYISGHRFFLQKLTKNGIEANDDAWSTKEAIELLLNSENYIVRYKMSELLRNRKEFGVPEALLSSIKKDDRLDVVVRSVDSFKEITGCPEVDVFGEEPLFIYWEKNKAEIVKKLKEPSDAVK
jgi:hypothetical protein